MKPSAFVKEYFVHSRHNLARGGGDNVSQSWKNVINIACCYVGAIIGAGFASGQELWSFFVIYGRDSLKGLILAGVLFCLYAAVVLLKIYRYRVTSLSDYFSGVLGKKTLVVLQAVVYLFMFSSFCVMVAGSGALVRQVAGLPVTVGILLMAGLCYIIFLFDARGVVRANAVLSPMMIAGILVVWAGVLLTGCAPVFHVTGTLSRITHNYAASAVIYVSYNTITVCALFIPLRQYLDRTRTAVFAAVSGGIVLMAIAGVLWYLVYIFRGEAAKYDIPMLFIAGQVNHLVQYLYVAVLYMAMITTAVSSGFGFLSWARTRVRLGMRPLAGLLCLAAIPLSYAGFAPLVGSLYRSFGYAGMFFLALVLIDGVYSLLRPKKYRLQMRKR